MRNSEDPYLTLHAAYQELRAAALVAKQRHAEIGKLPESQRDAALSDYIAILKRLESTAQSLLDITPDPDRTQRRRKLV